MYFISVYGEDERQLGWLNAKLKLVDDKALAAGFSSKQTAEETQAAVEHENPDWYTELEE